MRIRRIRVRTRRDERGDDRLIRPLHREVQRRLAGPEVTQFGVRPGLEQRVDACLPAGRHGQAERGHAMLVLRIEQSRVDAAPQDVQIVFRTETPAVGKPLREGRSLGFRHSCISGAGSDFAPTMLRLTECARQMLAS